MAYTQALSDEFRDCVYFLSPFLWNAANTYVVIPFPGRLGVRLASDINERTVMFEEIDRVCIEIDQDGSHLDPVFALELKSGERIDLWEIGLGATNVEELVRFGRFLAEDGVLISVGEPGSLEALRPSIQEDIRYVFEQLR